MPGSAKPRSLPAIFMKLRNPTNIFIFASLFSFASCSDNSSLMGPKVNESYTIKIMRLLIDSAFYRDELPGLSALTKNNLFGDTVIFRDEIYRGDTNISRYFPKDLKIKFLRQSQICSLATNLRNDSTYFPNFLEIRSFKKVDTTYEVYLQTTCVMPQFDKNGHHLYNKGKLEGIDTLPCIFGMLCGGGIGMTFTKQGDTLKSVITGRWSD